MGNPYHTRKNIHETVDQHCSIFPPQTKSYNMAQNPLHTSWYKFLFDQSLTIL